MASRSLLNRSAVKDYALSLSSTNRAGKFTRVSKKFLDRMEASFKVHVNDAVHRHPSVGKTLQ